LSGVALSHFLTQCTHSKYLTAKIIDSEIFIEKKEFLSNKQKIRSIIIENELLNFPIALLKIQENEYRAIYLTCSHQGAELQIFDDKLICPAHGAEFTNEGKVVSGPTDQPLRIFSVKTLNDQIIISLK
jgi:nitrite reductase/ring-hydroxylating ferredoxin subunit